MNVVVKYLLSFSVASIFVLLGYNNTEIKVAEEYKPPILEEVSVDKLYVPEPEVIEVDTDQVHCLATNIYHEARGESFSGKIAVANVVLNRVESKKYPNTICDVVYQAVYSEWWLETHQRLVPVRNKCQFSWFCDGKSDAIHLTDSRGRTIKANLQAWEESLAVALDAVRGQLDDTIEGATHYHAHYVNPEWTNAMLLVDTIDNHIFYKTY